VFCIFFLQINSKQYIVTILDSISSPSWTCRRHSVFSTSKGHDAQFWESLIAGPAGNWKIFTRILDLQKQSNVLLKSVK